MYLSSVLILSPIPNSGFPKPVVPPPHSDTLPEIELSLRDSTGRVMRRSLSILIPSLTQMTYRKPTNRCVHGKNLCMKGLDFCWSGTDLPGCDHTQRSSARKTSPPEQPELCNPASQSPILLGNRSEVNKSNRGRKARGPVEEGMKCIFQKCTARSSPGRDFSFIFIDLQNKPG